MPNFSSPIFSPIILQFITSQLRCVGVIFSQVKLQTSKEQLALARRQNETCEDTTQTLEARVAELTAQLDTTRGQATQLAAEKDMLIKSLDSARAEKNALDKNRVEINTMVSILNKSILLFIFIIDNKEVNTPAKKFISVLGKTQSVMKLQFIKSNLK